MIIPIVYKGRKIYLFSMAFVVLAFAFVGWCELTGGITYPNPRFSIIWAICLPSLLAAFIQFREERIWREKRQKDKEIREQSQTIIRRLYGQEPNTHTD